MRTALALCALLFVVLPVPADARTFGGYLCTVDCSGHAAGYLWAEQKNIDDEARCPSGPSQSFNEGCLAYVQDTNRGADEDDDGEPID